MLNMNKPVILVTGGAGCIGSHLCKALLDKNNHVICMDNYWSGNKRNIQNFFENPDFEFIQQDVIKSYDFYEDEIYTPACYALLPSTKKTVFLPLKRVF